MKNKAIFFDRDGVINHRLIGDYVKNYHEFSFFEDFFNIFKLIKSKNFLAIVITNQQGIGKKLMTENDLNDIHCKMQENIFNLTSFKFDDIYFCSDLKELNSFRRKPNPGMLLEAIEKWNIDPTQSIMIGDSLSDTKAGKSANLTTILLNSNIDEHESCDYIVSSHFEIYNLLKTIIKD